MLRCRGVVLRDKKLDDIDDYVRWFCSEVEWQRWDAPWEHQGSPPSPETKRARLLEYFPHDLPEIRTFFEIDGPDGAHLGWTNRYRIKGPPDIFAIGICLPDVERGGRGVGTVAFALHAAYRFRRDGLSALYTETWSGNLRMIGLARRLGFEECRREPGVREIDGTQYDGLRFSVTLNRLYARCPWLGEAEGV
jgi:RimJ/RimL family protein N-acetyltransferase